MLRKMKIIGVAALLLAATFHTYAIENLTLSLQCSNVVLSWPSTAGDTYVIRYRPDLTTNSSWTVLADLYPATGTNTFFVHTGIVLHPNCGGIGGAMAMSLSASSGMTVPSAMVADTSTLSPDDLPYPWNPKFQYTSQPVMGAAIMSGSGISPDGAGTPTPDGLTGSGTDMGFYEVVKDGVHLFGITNGMVVSGQVNLLAEYANLNADQALTALYLADDDVNSNYVAPRGVSFPGAADMATNNVIQGVWDTTQVANGTYTLQLAAAENDPTVLFLDHPVTVTVSNKIWFPNDYAWGGQGVYVGAQTAFPGGVWTLYLYDDQGNKFGPWTGQIDADGWCNYTGIPGPGFTINNTDVNGNQNPSDYYKLAMTAGPAVQPLGPTFTVTNTNIQIIEPYWYYVNTTALNVFMPMFTQGGQTELLLETMINTVYTIVNPFHQETLGGFDAPFALNSKNQWDTFYATLGGRTNSVNFWNRDLYYLGHGNDGRIGDSNGITAESIQVKLGTLHDVLKSTNAISNRQPYRFVFLDGCLTAKSGRLAVAFGIPDVEGLTNGSFWARGIRPRSFLGWKTKKVSGWVGDGFFYTDHATWVTDFYNHWAADLEPDGTPLKIINAIKRSANTTGNPGYFNQASLGWRLFGSTDMIINY